MDGRWDRKSVLVYTEAWGRGGCETFSMNMFRCLAPLGFHFDLFSTWSWNESYDGELQDLGVFRTTVFNGFKPGQLKRLVEGNREFGRMLDAFPYDAVYINTLNGMGFSYAETARRHGVVERIVHSHSAGLGDGMGAVKAIAHRIGRSVLSGSATARLACSHAAGAHLFGKGSFEILSNGVDANRFRYDEAERHRVRALLDIPTDAVVLGTVGRHSAEKNPLFLVDVFACLAGSRRDAYLLMVGTGPLSGAVESHVKSKDLSDRVRLISVSDDIPGMLSAMDVFCLPSLYEGLPFSLVEAQASGLPVLASNAIDGGAEILESFRSLPLSVGAKFWPETVDAMCLASGGDCSERSMASVKVENAGFGMRCFENNLLGVFGIRQSCTPESENARTTEYRS